LSQELQGHEYLGYAAPHVAPGPTQTAFPDPWVHYASPPDMLAAENLRRLASRFLRHPDSQIVMIRMEPGLDGRFRVVISLEMAHFL
jgi:hypothetical protein